METGKKKLETGKWKLPARMPACWERVSDFEFPVSNLQFPISSFQYLCLKWLVAGVAVACILGAANAAFAQGCAMCYTSAAAAKAGALQALRSGILILFVPVILMCGVIAVVVYRRRNQFSEDPDWTEEQDRELRYLLARMEPESQLEAPSPEVESHSPVS